MYLKSSHCPESVVVVEPILDAFSGYVPCSERDSSGRSDSKGSGKTLVTVLPITFKDYTSVMSMLPMPDAVVCIGCDSHYGPNRKMLESTFGRPFTLYLEYPSEYVHNTAYRRMGKGPGEMMTYYNNYEVKTTATKYTKRAMKVIRYEVTQIV